MPAYYTPSQGTDFTITPVAGGYEWISCGAIYGDNYTSDDTFDTEAEAITDAVDFLAGEYDSLIADALPERDA